MKIKITTQIAITIHAQTAILAWKIVAHRGFFMPPIAIHHLPLPPLLLPPSYARGDIIVNLHTTDIVQAVITAFLGHTVSTIKNIYAQKDTIPANI